MNTKYSNTDKDIHKRIFNYIVIGLKVIKVIPKTTENLPLINQVCRSLTSIGANDQEADGAITRRDFSSKYSIVLKETKETIYWWEILKASDFKNEKLEWLITEGKEIFRVVFAILKNTKNKV